MVVNSNSGPLIFTKRFALLIMLQLVSQYCTADSVYIGRYKSFDDYYSTPLVDFYNSQSDTTCVRSSMMPANINQYDLYITYDAGRNTHDNCCEYTPSEITSLKNYLRNGGRILLFTDHTNVGTFSKEIDSYLNNTLLPQVGSEMSLSGGCYDIIYYVASGAQIQSDQFTQGIQNVVYAATNSIQGGTPLLRTSDLNHVFLSYEKIGKGYLFISGDIDLMWKMTYYPSYDNGKLFNNILTVPEPCTLGLLLFGGLILQRKYKS